MKIHGKTTAAYFQKRLNRFLASVKIQNISVDCFVPNPGRMHDLLFPGVEVLLKKVINKDRKTSFDLIAVFNGGYLISVDSRVPNKLIAECLRNGELEEFSRYDVVKPEFYYNHSRIDFLLKRDEEKCLLEVKSCTLAENAIAMFPDAPTERGRRHLKALIKAKKEGYRASMFFLIQRPDAKIFSPNDKIDPEFGRILRLAAEEGVEVYAYSSEFTGDEFMLRGRVKVLLGGI